MSRKANVSQSSLTNRVNDAMAATQDGNTKTSGWHQQDIQSEIRKRGSTIAELSRQHGLNRGTLQGVFSKRYPKGQAIVAAFIGRSRHELWPHWYGPEDQLLPLGGRLHVVAERAA